MYIVRSALCGLYMDHPIPNQMSEAFFPMTSRDGTVSFGRIVVSADKRPGGEYMTATERRDGPAFHISRRLVSTSPGVHDSSRPDTMYHSDKPLSVFAAINACAAPTVDTYIDVDTENGVEFTGASCGLAVFAAIASHVIPPRVFCTGFVMEDGNGKPSELRIMEIDNVAKKILPFLENTDTPPLFIPFCCLDYVPEVHRGRVYTMSHFVRKVPHVSYRIVAVASVGDFCVLASLFLPPQSQSATASYGKNVKMTNKKKK